MGIKVNQKYGRNDPCPCTSGLKYKYCHGDEGKLRACNQAARLHMVGLIIEERKKRGLQPYGYTCEKCGKGTDRPRKSELANILLCPIEGCDGAVKRNEPESKPDKDGKDNPIILGA